MVNMHSPLAAVQSAWQTQYPGQPFPGKAAAVASLSGSAPVTRAAAPASTDTAAALTRLHDKIDAALAVNETRINQVAASWDSALTRTDDRLSGEVQGLAGQVSGIAAGVQSLDAAMRRAAERPAVDPSAVAGQVAAAVREAFKPFEATVRAEGREAEVLAVAEALPSESDALAVFGLDIKDMRGRTVPVHCYASPAAESADPMFIWQAEILRHLLLSQSTGEPLWLGGEKGTGKSETVRQFAARTGRE